MELTDFLAPPEVVAVEAAVRKVHGDALRVVRIGGWERAERCRLALGGREAADAAAADAGAAVALLEVSPARRGAALAVTHRDFLGAATGAGVERSKLGDVVVRSDGGGTDCDVVGAFVFVVPELAPHLCATLTSVRDATVLTEEVPLDAFVAPPAERAENVRTTEASARLDALASAGFKLSRSKMLARIKAGDVRVNWVAAPKPEQQLAPGDVVSCRGLGRVRVDALEPTKRDSRIAVELTRFV